MTLAHHHNELSLSAGIGFAMSLLLPSGGLPPRVRYLKSSPGALHSLLSKLL